MSDLPVPVEKSSAIPVLPLRDVVVYPHMVIPLFVGREKSILALEAAMKGDKRIMLVAQRQAEVDDPKQDDLYKIGTLATILQLLKLPDGTVSAALWRACKAGRSTPPRWRPPPRLTSTTIKSSRCSPARWSRSSSSM
jgi:ATP-dependent Lon protease